MVILRMFTAAELDYFDRSPEQRADPFNFFGFRGSQSERARFADNQLIGPDRGLLAVEHDNELIGDVGWHPEAYGMATPPAFNIGISLLPEHRGRGYGADAQRQLAEYLFATHNINRVEACTDVTNLAEQRALTKAGFSREGVLRGAQWRAGTWRDLVLFSRLRHDPPTGTR